MADDKIELIECTNTFQGEGPDIGQRVVLCRFKHCNRICSYCDTLVKMRVQEEMEFSLSKLQNIINDTNCGLMVTGGEPTYDKNLDYTIKMLNELDYPVANVETNGYDIVNLLKKVDNFKNIKFIISPKVFNSNELEQFKKFFENVLEDKRIYFKIVVPDDYDSEIIQIINDYGYNDRTYLMPKGTNDKELQESYPYVLDLAEEFSVNITTRLHLNYQIV